MVSNIYTIVNATKKREEYFIGDQIVYWSKTDIQNWPKRESFILAENFPAHISSPVHGDL